MHIVITRPKEDSLHLIENLIKLGHEVTHLPVIKIEKLETKKIDLLNYQAVIFTSSNGIRFMNIEKFNSKIKCFCVGKATEFTAKKVLMETPKIHYELARRERHLIRGIKYHACISTCPRSPSRNI